MWAQEAERRDAAWSPVDRSRTAKSVLRRARAKLRYMARVSFNVLGAEILNFPIRLSEVQRIIEKRKNEIIDAWNKYRGS